MNFLDALEIVEKFDGQQAKKRLLREDLTSCREILEDAKAEGTRLNHNEQRLLELSRLQQKLINQGHIKR